MRYLLDTNVLSEVIKKRPSQRVLARLAAVPSANLYTSVVCLMEMRFGAARRADGGRLWNRIREEVLPRIQVLSIGEEEAIRCGEILALLEARGQPIGVEDVLIAATALEHGLRVPTRNTSHMDRIDGVAVENWWL